jgi:hypothetical protein
LGCGTSDNDISITDQAAGRRSGSFDTDRWLASANLTGNYYYNAWRFSPQIGIDDGNETFDTTGTACRESCGGAIRVSAVSGAG